MCTLAALAATRRPSLLLKGTKRGAITPVSIVVQGSNAGAYTQSKRLACAVVLAGNLLSERNIWNSCHQRAPNHGLVVCSYYHGVSRSTARVGDHGPISVRARHTTVATVYNLLAAICAR